MYSFKKNINRNNIFKNSFGKDNVEPILIKTLISKFYNNWAFVIYSNSNILSELFDWFAE